MPDLAPEPRHGGTVHVVDDDADLCQSVTRLLRRRGFDAHAFHDPAALMAAQLSQPAHCIVTDVMMGDVDGFELARRLRADAPWVALIFMTAWPRTTHAVDAVRRFGGLDYLEKPLDEQRLVAAAREGVEWSIRYRRARERTTSLTRREREVFDLLVIGQSSKMIAAALALSPKTIEDHRASIMAKTGANGLAQLIAIARDEEMEGK